MISTASSIKACSRVLWSLPGISVGDQFFSRCELSAIGLHGHWLAGIDYLGASHKAKMVKFFNSLQATVALMCL